MDFDSLHALLDAQAEALDRAKKSVKAALSFGLTLRIKLEEDSKTDEPAPTANTEQARKPRSRSGKSHKSETEPGSTSRSNKRTAEKPDRQAVQAVAHPIGKDRPLTLPTKRPRRKYKFRNVAGGYVYNEQLHEARLPELPDGILLGSHPSRQRTLIGFATEEEAFTPEQQAEIRNGCLPVRKLVLEQLTVEEWMALARFKCEELDKIDSLTDPRIHDLGNEALRTYVVHFLKGNYSPDPERGDDCKGSPKLTPEQCHQIFTARVWATCPGADQDLVTASQIVLRYYFWSGWKVRSTPAQICAIEEHLKPAVYREGADSKLFPNPCNSSN
jgi:hypothetical protein